MIIAAKSRIAVQKLYAALDAIVRKLGSTIKMLALPSDQDNDSRIAALLGDFLDFSSTSVPDPRDYHEVDIEVFPVSGAVVENSSPICQRTERICVALTHETLRSFLLESTWLRRHLPQEMTMDNITSCWLDLYIKELVTCVLERNDSVATLHQQFEAYIEKVEKHLCDDEKASWHSHEEELMELLALWTRWTPLLPYALTEILAEIRSCSTLEPQLALLHRLDYS